MRIHQTDIWNPETGITDLPSNWKDLRASELESIQEIWQEQRERLKGTEQLNEFSEQLTREWAIETGILENLYEIDRGVTETLIAHGFRAELLTNGAANKPSDYIVNLLKDQKDALDGVFDFVSKTRSLSTSYIKELHAALLRSQTRVEAVDTLGNHVEVPLTPGDWKAQPNYPTRDGTIYAYAPPEQVASEMDRLITMHLEHRKLCVPSEIEAAWLHHRFTQIHPFQDGNGRVARALASLVLIQAGLFPLVVTRDDKVVYLDALEAADKGNLGPFVSLVARLQRVQFRKATAISEGILTTQVDVKQVLGSLQEAAKRREQERAQTLRQVFDQAHALELDLRERLEGIIPDLLLALRRVTPGATAYVSRSDQSTSHYFRSQIIENAKYHLRYFADTSDYRSWVSLNMIWQRRAKLVFAFHGIGRPFSGTLVCAPFLEFRDSDDEGEMRAAFVPAADEAFVFFYNETRKNTLNRFESWREKVLTIALKELSQNL